MDPISCNAHSRPVSFESAPPTGVERGAEPNRRAKSAIIVLVRLLARQAAAELGTRASDHPVTSGAAA